MSLTITASTIVRYAIIEPGLKSMPPVRMTTVAPMATIDSTATCSAMLRKFSAARKLGVVTATTAMINSSAAVGPANWLRTERFMSSLLQG